MVDKIIGSPVRQLYEAKVGDSLTGEAGGVSFSDLLKETIQKLNQSQVEADNAINGFLKGDITDLHKVMITLQKADMSLSMAMQFRTKIINAYEEVMRMQV